MVGWEPGLGPWTPVLRDGRLYGRGGADDGYAVFSAVTAIKALRDAGVPHSRIVVLIECCEESGSPDLPAYIDLLADQIGTPRLDEAKRTSAILGHEVWSKFPFVDGARPMSDDPLELLLNRTWRPALSYTGQAGFPDLVQGGNVLRPSTSIKLSLRIPPSLDA